MTSDTLWTCPDCGRQFARKGQSHACVIYTPEEHLEKATPAAQAMYAAFYALVEKCGEFFIEATKTSIAFKTPRLLAAIAFHKQGINITFWLPHPLADPRIHKVYDTGSDYAHHLRVRSLDEIDAQIQNWLCEAYLFASQ
ncbi:MAG: hypothetical protein DWQ07_21705 [Chloroflexi bacterium]|nr:MAG: hypothetical protein DWQ07_21705 [Chloroflexota bacterium]MBL1197333.1 hypothetical protein [Chloroflexota bacterium]NOH14628.1 hypothetical protein [Chloroflexota bacterium]